MDDIAEQPKEEGVLDAISKLETTVSDIFGMVFPAHESTKKEAGEPMPKSTIVEIKLKIVRINGKLKDVRNELRMLK